MLCTSGFVDYIMLAHSGWPLWHVANGVYTQSDSPGVRTGQSVMTAIVLLHFDFAELVCLVGTALSDE